MREDLVETYRRYRNIYQKTGKQKKLYFFYRQLYVKSEKKKKKETQEQMLDQYQETERDEQIEAELQMNPNSKEMQEHTIMYDPCTNQHGHYEKLKKSLKNVYKHKLTYITDIESFKNFPFSNRTFYIIYIYVIKNVMTLNEIIPYVNNKSENVNFFINTWEPTDYETLQSICGNYNNVFMISDFHKHNIINKKIISLNPPIMDYKNKYDLKKNPLNIGKYVVTWTWKNNNHNKNIKNNRWFKTNEIKQIADILKRKKLKLLVIEFSKETLTETSKHFNLKVNDNIYTYEGKITNENVFLSICKNAEYCFIYSQANFYKVKSSGKISELLYHDIPFVTNLDIRKMNNLHYGRTINTIKNINELETIDKVDKIQSNIKETSWVNINFKKLLYLYNYSKIIGSDTIDVLGNGPSLKNYNFENSNIKLGMNVAYRYWNKHGIYPDIYIALDKVVTKFHAKEIHDLIQKCKIKLFILSETYFEVYPNDIYLENVYNFNLIKSSHYLLDSNHITTGMMSIRLSLILGFKKLNIYGINDSKYVNYIPECKEIMLGKLKVLKIVKTIRDNPNYFFNEYQKVGDVYNIPNREKTFFCKCNYHKKSFESRPLHEYVWEVLFFHLKFYKIKYNFEVNQNKKILTIFSN